MMYPKKIIIAIAFFMSHFLNAQTNLKDSLQQKLINGTDHEKAHAYILLSTDVARVDVTKAKEYSFAAIEMAKNIEQKNEIWSAAYSQLMLINLQTGKKDSAEYYLQSMKNICDQDANPRVKQNYTMAASLFYRKQGNFTKALPFMFESLQNAEKIGIKESAAGQLLNIGNTYTDMGQYREAFAYHLKALHLFETIGNKRGISFCYGALGGDFIKLGQYTTALDYTEKSLALKQEVNDKKGLANGWRSKGDIYLGMKNYPLSLSNYFQALNMNHDLKLMDEEAKTDLAIVEVYKQTNDERKAMDYLNRSKDLFIQLKDSAFIVNVNSEITSMQRNDAKRLVSEKTLFGALDNSKKMGNKDAELTNYQYLEKFYEDNKQYDKALAYNKKYHAAADSLDDNELRMQMDKLVANYNLDKQEKEILLLKKDQLLNQAESQRQRLFLYGSIIVFCFLLLSGFLFITRFRYVQKTKRLLEIEKIRNNIARNLHDDIGSTLTSINILSKVALEQAGDNSKIAGDLEKIKNRSSNLMENMGDIIWAINPANDLLEKTIIKMKEFAVEMLEPAGIQFSFAEQSDLDDLKLNIESRKNLYLFFKEAVHNIVKHSKATEVVIDLKKENNHFILKVTDNGIGFDNCRQFTGNGLKNMQSRATELHASFLINSENGKGTNISLRLPIT